MRPHTAKIFHLLLDYLLWKAENLPWVLDKVYGLNRLEEDWEIPHCQHWSWCNKCDLCPSKHLFLMLNIYWPVNQAHPVYKSVIALCHYQTPGPSCSKHHKLNKLAEQFRFYVSKHSRAGKLLLDSVYGKSLLLAEKQNLLQFLKQLDEYTSYLDQKRQL